MTTQLTISASEARSNFYHLLDEVANKFKRYIITNKGKTKAIVMPLEEVEAWEETMEIMANKKLMRDIREGEEDIKKGRIISHDALLKELGISKKDLE